ncbi:hypothetical protein LTR56_020696 [Elasticomyces elasticus]|nr:hypothetical protein LTR22_028473 [Elasticomyces elasticus]KAK3624965.1 hypothetical protein LTR56_020696 [Elasticomyces elasticus]KAK5747622.1 hypothetical protein LTS12_022320 [Elasticomyces elasticus]
MESHGYQSHELEDEPLEHIKYRGESSNSAALQPMPLFRVQPTLHYFQPRRALPTKQTKQFQAAQQVAAPTEQIALLGTESHEFPRPQTPFEELAEMPQQTSVSPTGSAWEDIFTSFDTPRSVNTGGDSSNAAHMRVVAALHPEEPYILLTRHPCAAATRLR